MIVPRVELFVELFMQLRARQLLLDTLIQVLNDARLSYRTERWRGGITEQCRQGLTLGMRWSYQSEGRHKPQVRGVALLCLRLVHSGWPSQQTATAAATEVDSVISSGAQDAHKWH